MQSEVKSRRKLLWRVVLCFATVIMWLGLSFAADAAPGDSSSPNNAENAGAAASVPATPKVAPKGTSSESMLTVGWDQRWRNEEWNNLQDYSNLKDDERTQNTFRQRFWVSAPLFQGNTIFYVRILNQFTKQEKNGTVPPASRKLNSGEVILDNLYFNFKKTPIEGLSLKIGRQDMMFGEGFLIMDGSGAEGPRTSYFNAFDLTYQLKGRKSTFDVLGILNPRQERILPVIHNQHQVLDEWDQQMAGLYYQDRNTKNFSWDAYYLLKKEIHDYRSPSNLQFQPDRHVSTIGTRMVKTMPKGLSVTGEFAYQWGYQHANQVLSRPAQDIHAWGGYIYGKQQFNVKLKPYVLVGYWALSGDDGKTAGTNEGFDPLFSRWPKWSGGYVFSQIPEKGIGYWTNLKMPQFEAGFTPVKPLTVKGVLYIMDAFHPFTLTNNSAVFGTGTHRATTPELLASYKFSDKVAGEFRYELMKAGDFYAVGNKGQYFRFEINYSWKKALDFKGDK